MRGITFILFGTLLVQAIFSGAGAVQQMQHRSADTCADPSLTDVYVAGFSPFNVAHVVSPRGLLTLERSTGQSDWEIQGNIFLAWQTPQNFTVPFYRLVNSVIADWITQISVDGAPPVINGYSEATIIGYAYSTQVCGSVPLLGAFQPSIGDHWYTTSVSEHNFYLANGWVDAGAGAFVLPLSAECGCSS